MADAYYFDANALVYWAVGRAGSKKPEEQQCASALDALVDGDDSLACSPPTLAEYTTTLWSIARSTGADISFFTEAEADASVSAVMGLLATGRLRVHNLRPRAFEVGMALVAAGAREKERRFSAWDAIHLYEAAQWSRTINRTVTVATSDSDFTRIIESFPEFGRYVEIRDLTA